MIGNVNVVELEIVKWPWNISRILRLILVPSEAAHTKIKTGEILLKYFRHPKHSQTDLFCVSTKLTKQ